MQTFKELMEETDWDSYGVGNYEKCANCMVHCGFEATAVIDTFKRPLAALGVMLRGVRTDGPMAPEIPLTMEEMVVSILIASSSFWRVVAQLITMMSKNNPYAPSAQ